MSLKLVRDKECDAPEGWTVSVKKPGDCSHLSVEVDSELRRANCALCGEVLDPIQVLINMAKHEEKIVSRIEYLEMLEKMRSEKQKSERNEAKRKERKQLIAAFGESAMTDFNAYGGQLITQDSRQFWINEFIHIASSVMFGVERRSPRFWIGEGEGRKYHMPISADQLKQRFAKKGSTK